MVTWLIQFVKWFVWLGLTLSLAYSAFDEWLWRVGIYQYSCAPPLSILGQVKSAFVHHPSTAIANDAKFFAVCISLALIVADLKYGNQAHLKIQGWIMRLRTPRGLMISAVGLGLYILIKCIAHGLDIFFVPILFLLAIGALLGFLIFEER